MEATRQHPRTFERNRFVYPVVSRRSRGVSIGINVNPDKRCNFDCVYCQVNRRAPGADSQVEPLEMERELRELVRMARFRELANFEPFRSTPPEWLELHDIALSGDGEPTIASNFAGLCEIADRVRREEGPPGLKLVLITNATALTSPATRRGLRFFGESDEIWAKLDAGTQANLKRLDRTGVPIEKILEGILSAGRERPIVIQSLFFKFQDDGPSAAEIEAYLGRLGDLRAAGCRIQEVQVYSIARPPAEAEAQPLEPERLKAIAGAVRALDIPAVAY